MPHLKPMMFSCLSSSLVDRLLRPEALGVHGEMHLVLEARVLAARQQLGVVGDDVGQRLDPVALGLGEIAEHVSDAPAP